MGFVTTVCPENVKQRTNSWINILIQKSDSIMDLAWHGDQVTLLARWVDNELRKLKNPITN